jgi:hypothetical protein
MEKYTRKNNKKIKVGVFSIEDLKSNFFLKAWEKKSKETGLTNIDLKTINKGGKTFIEFYLIPNKSDSDVKIKDWYMKNYPNDDLGEELNDEVTFENMWNEDYKKYDIYQVMGVGDSLIRERLFEHLAEIKGVSYDVVYKKLFLSDGFYANGGGVGQIEHFTLDKDKLNEDAKWYADRIKSGQMSTTKKSIEERIEEYKKDLFLLEIGRKRPSNIIGTGYKGNAKKMANTWLLQEIYKDTKILELLGDNYSNGGGVGLKGNQSRIDMNHNGKIDADDFTILRNSMNGAWRNEHKHVNSTSTKNGKVIQYETRYARKHNPSRKGYKGKGNFKDGGAFERLSNSVAKRYEGDAVAPKYQRMYGKTYSREEAKEVGDKVAGKVKAMQMVNKKAFGGFFDKNIPFIKKTNYPDLDDKQVMLKNGEYVQVVEQMDDVLMVINSNQLGTGIRPKRINISEVDMSSFM